MIQQYILGVNESGGTEEIDQISVTAPPNFLSTLTFNHLTMSIKSLSKEFVHGAKYYYNSKIEKNKQKIKALVTPEEFEKINHFDTIENAGPGFLNIKNIFQTKNRTVQTISKLKACLKSFLD